MAEKRQRWCFRDGELVPYEGSSSSSSFHTIIDDTMPPTENHADGRIYNSKSAFRRATKACGYEEVGNDLLTKQPSRRKKVTDYIPEQRIDNALKEAFERHGGYGRE